MDPYIRCRRWQTIILLRCDKLRRDYSRQHFVVVPMLISGSMVEIRGIKMFWPNLDDPDDLFAYIKQQHQLLISLQRIREEWWKIALMPRAIVQLVVQHIKCYCPDLGLCPKHCMLFRWHAISMWCVPVYFVDGFFLLPRYNLRRLNCDGYDHLYWW